MARAMLIVTSLLGLLMTGCHHQHAPKKNEDATARYFRTPQEAVSRINALMKEQNWPVLTSYYDISGTDLDRSELTSGQFFLRTQRPPDAHPGLNWRQRAPFPPGFVFDHVEKTADPKVVTVVVSIEIDEGGGMKQRGLASFVLRKSAKGYQVVPDVEAYRRERGDRTSSGADTIFQLRPDLARQLPAADLENLVSLLRQLDRLNEAIASHTAGSNRAPVFAAGIERYPASDEQLLASEAGRRIEQIVEQNHPRDVCAKLDAAGYSKVQIRYDRIPVHHADVAGTGDVCYAGSPEPREFMLPKKMRGF